MALPQGPAVGKAMDAPMLPDSRPAWPTKLLVFTADRETENPGTRNSDYPLALGTNVHVP